MEEIVQNDNVSVAVIKLWTGKTIACVGFPKGASPIQMEEDLKNISATRGRDVVVSCIPGAKNPFFIEIGEDGHITTHFSEQISEDYPVNDKEKYLDAVRAVITDPAISVV